MSAQNRYAYLPGWVVFDWEQGRPVALRTPTAATDFSPHPGETGPPMDFFHVERAAAYERADEPAKALLEATWITPPEWPERVKAEVQLLRQEMAARKREQDRVRAEREAREAAEAAVRAAQWEIDRERRREESQRRALVRQEADKKRELTTLRMSQAPLGKWASRRIAELRDLGFDEKAARAIVANEKHRMIVRAKSAGASNQEMRRVSGASHIGGIVNRSEYLAGRRQLTLREFDPPQIAPFAQEVRRAERKAAGRAAKMQAQAAELQAKAQELLERAARASAMAEALCERAVAQ